METLMNTDLANATIKQVITQVVNAWLSQNKSLLDLLSKYPEEVYSKEVAPGRNRAIYLFGHLTAFNDGLLPMLGLGERLFPQLEEIFVTGPDKKQKDIPTLRELKDSWTTVIKTLTGKFNEMDSNDWLSGHTKVSAEDFVKDPLRNKLNVLIGRTNHQSYHIGQLNLLNENK